MRKRKCCDDSHRNTKLIAHWGYLFGKYDDCAELHSADKRTNSMLQSMRTQRSSGIFACRIPCRGRTLLRHSGEALCVKRRSSAAQRPKLKYKEINLNELETHPQATSSEHLREAHLQTHINCAKTQNPKPKIHSLSAHQLEDNPNLQNEVLPARHCSFRRHSRCCRCSRARRQYQDGNSRRQARMRDERHWKR